VEEANLTVNISALRKAIGRNSRRPAIHRDRPQAGISLCCPGHGAPRQRQSAPAIQQTSKIELAAEVPPAPKEPVGSLRWWLAAGLTSIAILLSWIFVSRHQAKLSERDKIVLADFTNTTADPVFDDALRQGLCSQLEQSPFLNLPSDECINQMTFAAPA